MCVHWLSKAFNYAPLKVHGDVNWEGVSRNSCQGHVPTESANNATANPPPPPTRSDPGPSAWRTQRLVKPGGQEARLAPSHPRIRHPRAPGLSDN